MLLIAFTFRGKIDRVTPFLLLSVYSQQLIKIGNLKRFAGKGFANFFSRKSLPGYSLKLAFKNPFIISNEVKSLLENEKSFLKLVNHN
jgi:hypothetical protein